MNEEELYDEWIPGTPITEYGVRFQGGDMNVFTSHPEVEEVYPMKRRLAAHRRHGGKVYRRVITVVEDWQEMSDDDERHSKD